MSSSVAASRIFRTVNISRIISHLRYSAVAASSTAISSIGIKPADQSLRQPNGRDALYLNWNAPFPLSFGTQSAIPELNRFLFGGSSGEYDDFFGPESIGECYGSDEFDSSDFEGSSDDENIEDFDNETEDEVDDR